jgi:hypothetical protein
VTIARASMAAAFPARMTLVGAMNPSLPLWPARPSRESLYRHAPGGEKICGARLASISTSQASTVSSGNDRSMPPRVVFRIAVDSPSDLC